MPANLPPEYYTAEKAYKEASTPAERIAALEELISTIPKHKGTDKIRADFRRRLSKLRDSASKQKKSGRGDLYNVQRQGAAQATLMGFANAGKSSMLKALTNANPAIAEYPMTTHMPLSGMMPFEDIQFQLVDLPPVGNEHTDGWVSGIVRNTDIVLLVLDLTDAPQIQAELLLEELDNWRIPLGGKGAGAGVANAKKAIVVGTKSDLPGAGEGLGQIRAAYDERFPVIGVSAKGAGLEEFKRAVFDTAGIIRVYSKQPGREPDMGCPFTLPAGFTVLQLARQIHKDFTKTLKYACIWGSSRFPGQRVQKDYELKDRDIVEIHI